MPTSYPQSISPILMVISQLRPRSMLDIGVGSGKYGVLCREVLDQWVWAAEGPGRHARIDGIEAHEAYVGALHRAVYDEVFIGDASQLVHTIEQHYDLALLVDVFEHFEVPAGRALVEALAPRATHILVSVPAHFWAQGAEHGNEFERHRAHYTPAQLRALGFSQVWRVWDSYVALRSEQTVELRWPLLRYGWFGLPPAALTALWRRLRYRERPR